MSDAPRPPDGEAELTTRLVELLDGCQRATAPQLRAQHLKTAACLAVEFTVSDAVPPALAHGVFARPATYSGWVRVSNGYTWDDREPDFHGFALKLLGVPGPKLLESDESPGAQDFVLTTTPVFFASDVEGLYRFFARKVELATSGKSAEEAGRLLAAEYPKEFGLFTTRAAPARPPLEIEYWSCVPYRLGPHAVKYHARPQFDGPLTENLAGSPDFARETLVEWLTTRARPARFDFRVQLQEDPATMPIEDGAVTWGSPFHKVAELTIPAQTFATPERDALGERLSFNPWHALPEHAPLGGLNRARLVAYQTSAKVRRAANPTGETKRPT